MTTTLTGFTNNRFDSPQMSCNKITINNAPTSPKDGANKAYVDLTSGGFNFKNTCLVSTTANLTAVYANGAAGVGATLTNSGTQAAFSTDGVSPSINSRVLVQFQTTQSRNGIYTLTTVGTGATNWVLTRATDYDTAAEIQPGDIVPVSSGTLYDDTLWLQTEVVTTVGTDPINFNEFSGGITVDQYEVLVGGPANTVTSLGDTGTASQVLTSQGAGTNPIWMDNASGTLSLNIQPFSGDATYTPSANMVYVQIEVVGGGGGGGGANSQGSASAANVGGGGGGGGYCKGTYSAAQIGVSQSVTIGGGGSGGSPGNSGNSGGTTSVGGLISASGGSGGNSGGFSGSGGTSAASGGNGGGGAGGQANCSGSQGGFGICFSASGGPSAVSLGGYGGSSSGIGGGGVQGSTNWNGGSSGGQSGQYYGGGGSGASVAGAASGQNGGNGYGGYCVITEYIFT